MLVQDSSILMTNKVTDYMLHFVPSASIPLSRPHFDTYLYYVGSRMPYLQHLKIRCSSGVAVCEKSLCDLLESCRSLVSVSLPNFWIISAVFKILAQGTIKNIRFSDTGSDSGILFFFSLLDHIPDPFSSLTNLTLHMRYDRMINLLKIFSTPFLRCIHVLSPVNPTSKQVHSLEQVLSARYPEILDLNLGIRDVGSSVRYSDDDHGISLADLEPLFVLSKLEKLRIINHFPLNFSDEDIETFVSKFPTIRTLHLNEIPLYYKAKSRLT